MGRNNDDARNGGQRHELTAARPPADVQLQAALEYLAAGYSIVPQGSGERAKIPTIRGWTQYADSPPAEDDVHAWHRQGLLENIGLLTGTQHDGQYLIALDIDQPGLLEQLARVHFDVISCAPINKTGRGYHILLRTREPVPSGRYVWQGQEVEAKGEGGKITVPPSLHETGEQYTWGCWTPDDGFFPTDELPRLDDIPTVDRLADLGIVREPPTPPRPDGTNDYAARHPELVQAVQAELEARGNTQWSGESLRCRCPCPSHQNGDRNPSGQFNRGSGTLYCHKERKTFLLNEAAQMLDINPANYRTPRQAPNGRKPAQDAAPLTDYEGLGAALEQVPDDRLDMTDLGNARRLVARHGQDLRYCHDWKKWLVWDGTRWRIDNTGEVERLAKDTVEAIWEEAAQLPDANQVVALRGWATKSEGAAYIRKMQELAQSEPGIAVTPDQFDTHPFLLNCQNGTLDLRTGELLPHSREHLITKLAPVDYDPEAQRPAFEAFLGTITRGNANLMGFLQGIFGYTLTGDTREQASFWFLGPGANGKSTLLEVFRIMMGDYARQTEFDTFAVSQGNRIRNDLARLAGARMVSATEVENGRQLSQAAFKQTTGGDTLVARYLYQEHFEFEPQGKLFVAVNRLPYIDPGDEAMWRRILVVPFSVTIPPEKQDRQLRARLQAELSGILNWAVQGCQMWLQEGLAAPQEVRAATERARNALDPIADFLEECCDVGPGKSVSSKELYWAYSNWAHDNGKEPLSQNAFSRLLRERGFERWRTGKERGWQGLALRETQ